MPDPHKLILAGAMVTALLLAASPAHAQVLDAFGDTIGTGRFRQEQGQTIQTNHQPLTDVTHYTEGGPVKLWFHEENAAVTFSMWINDTIYSVKQAFVGENFDPDYTLVEGLPTTDVSNYYRAHLTSGIELVPACHSLRRVGIYPDVDVVYYFGSVGPKMSFIMNPGSSPSDLQLHFTGQDSLHIDLQGHLDIYHKQYFIRLSAAYAYQVNANNTITAVGWTPTYTGGGNDGIVSFDFDTYDTGLPLIFQIGQPPLGGGGGGGDAWRTLLGSQNVAGGDSWGNAAVAAPDGDILIAGSTIDDAFPATLGQSPHQGVWDIYYGRFEYDPSTPTDADLIFTTFYGGSGSEKPQIAHYGSDDVLYVGGWTNTANLVLAPPSDPADGTYWQGALKGTTDGLLLKANPANGFLLRSTYFGGQGDEMFTAVTEDLAGNLYFGGATTTSTGTYSGTCTAVSSGFPLCDPGGSAYQQTTNAGGTDVFLLKLDEDFTMLNSTYYGGTTDDLLYDMAHSFDQAGMNERIICVGRTDGSLPQGDPGDFWLPGISDSTAFIANFQTNGTIAWMTNLHGVYRLEAAIAQEATENLFVMGHTQDTDDIAVPTSNTCSAVTGTISICDPGNGAYQDNTVDRVDEYFAQFNVLTGEMLWSTLHGGSIRENADYTAGFEYEYHPFPIRRFSDLAIDHEEGILYALGIGMQAGDYSLMIGLDHPTLSAYGYYNQPWHPDMGMLQTEVLLKCFDGRRGRIWSSTFGSRLTHMFVNDPEEQQLDKQWRFRGCDWGHSLVLIPGEALYWAGSSGGMNFDDACPSGNALWCEPSLVFGGPELDLSYGFIARMNLDGLSIGQSESASLGESGLTCFPNPSDSWVTLLYNGTTVATRVFIVRDALGKIVLQGSTNSDSRIRFDGLARGLYSVSLLDKTNSVLATTRVLKQ